MIKTHILGYFTSCKVDLKTYQTIYPRSRFECDDRNKKSTNNHIPSEHLQFYSNREDIK